jgi:hypothetical protein
MALLYLEELNGFRVPFFSLHKQSIWLIISSCYCCIISEMTTKKISRSDRSLSNSMEDSERIWLKTKKVTETMKGLIRSIKMKAEEKIAIDDGISNLTVGVESMLDRIEMASSTADQKKLLVAYKEFLEHNIEAVNQRLKEIS